MSDRGVRCFGVRLVGHVDESDRCVRQLCQMVVSHRGVRWVCENHGVDGEIRMLASVSDFCLSDGCVSDGCVRWRCIVNRCVR